MDIKFVYNNKIESSIACILNKEGSIGIYIDNIDIDGVNILDNLIKNKDNIKIFISISNKTITRTILEELKNITPNIYYFNNNNSESKNGNFIYLIDDNIVEILFVTPNFEEENIKNADSISIYLKGSISDKEISKLLKKLAIRESEYIKLTKEVIEKLEDIKDLRNDKASTLTNIISRDEIKKSFRKINEVEDSEAFIQMVEMNSKIKYKGDDVLVGDKQENLIANFDNNEEIDIDLGE